MKPFKSHESPLYLVVITLVVCVICAVLVIIPVVTLAERQQRNARNAFQIAVLRTALISTKGVSDIDTLFRRSFVPVPLKLITGRPAPDVKALKSDMAQAIRNGKPIPTAEDLAKIKRMSPVQIIYIVLGADRRVRGVLLPVRGRGLWSMLWGYAFVDPRGHELLSLGFYKQGETPGLGARIQDPQWIDQFRGKRIYKTGGLVGLGVKKNVKPQDPYKVDSITGATLTSNGVNNLLKYWLGKWGYKPFLRHLQDGSLDLEK